MGRTIIKRLEWLGGWDDLIIDVGRYENGDIGFILVSQDGEPVSKPTTNLEEIGIRPKTGCFFIKDYSEHIGLGAALVEAGVIVPTGRDDVLYGPFNSPATEYRFTPDYEPEG